MSDGTGNTTRPITPDDMHIYDTPLSREPRVEINCYGADCIVARVAETIHVGPGVYDECITLSSWPSSSPIRFIEPAPWYAGDWWILPAVIVISWIGMRLLRSRQELA